MFDLAEVGLAEWTGARDAAARRRALAGVAELRRTLRRPASAALARWVDEIADVDGDLPLLGTGRRAGWFEALQWNGARHPADPVLVAGLLGAADDVSPIELGRAVLAADVVTSVAVAAHGEGAAVADVRTLGCAVVGCLVTALGPAALVDVLDVAAGLMLLSAPGGGSRADRLGLLRAGHPVAAGRLACESVAAGLTGSAGAATLATTTGPPPAEPLRVGDVVAALQ